MLDWYYTLHLGHKADSGDGSGISPWTQYVLEDPFNACLEEVCQTAEWSGVPDILGPGVMINSFIQAALATILGLVALYEWRIRWKRVSPSKKQRLIFDAQQANLALFLDASLVLNISICIATLVLIARRNANGDDTEVTLAHNMVLFSTYACLLPVLVDHAVNGERSRLMSRRVCFVIAGVLNFVTNLLAGSVSASLDNPSNWERLCFWDILPRERQVTIPILLTASCVFVLLAIVFGAGPMALNKFRPDTARSLRRWRETIGPFVILIMWFQMWYSLINITVVRQRLLERSGFNSEDVKWSFGQILALGTFLPVFVELGYLFRNGVDGALNERVPSGWVVVRAEDAALLAALRDPAGAASTDALAQAGGLGEGQELLVCPVGGSAWPIPGQPTHDTGSAYQGPSNPA